MIKEIFEIILDFFKKSENDHCNEKSNELMNYKKMSYYSSDPSS